jgi:hypothetical protein
MLSAWRSASKAQRKNSKGNPILYVGERLSYSACVREGKLPAGNFLINLRQSPLRGFIRKKVLIKPPQERLVGKISLYRDLERKKFRLNHCCTKPLRGSFLVPPSCSCLSFDALSFLQ